MSPAFAIVAPDEARQDPYPYVWVNRDGSARELHPKERSYLETPFEGADGGRPYVKRAYETKDGWGSLAGFLPRAKLPAASTTAPAPLEDPNPPMSPDEWFEHLKSMSPDIEVIRLPDGTTRIRKKNRGVARRLLDGLKRWIGRS